MKYVVLVVQAVQQQQELVAGECQVLCVVVFGKSKNEKER